MTVDARTPRYTRTMKRAGRILMLLVVMTWACGGNKLWHFANDQWSSINLPAMPYLTEATTLGSLKLNCWP